MRKEIHDIEDLERVVGGADTPEDPGGNWFNRLWEKVKQKVKEVYQK